MESLIAGLVGALIGAGASVATVWIQSSNHAKRDRLRLVMELSLEDYKHHLEMAKASGKAVTIPPITLFLHYHLELAKLMETGTISAKDMEKLTESNTEIHRAIEMADKNRRAADAKRA
jgi:hypothetical protein